MKALEILAQEVDRKADMAQDAYNEALEKMQKDLATDPSYALRWYAQDLMKAQCAQKQWLKTKEFVHRMIEEDNSFEEAVAIYKRHIDHETERVLGGSYLSQSTNPVSNLEQRCQQEALGEWISESKGLMSYCVEFK